MSEFRDIQRGPRRARIRGAADAVGTARDDGSPAAAISAFPPAGSSPPVTYMRHRNVFPTLGGSSPTHRLPVEEGDEMDAGIMNPRMGLAGNLDDSVDDALEYTEDGDYDEMIANVMDDDLDEDMGEDHDHDHEGDDCDDQIHEGPVFDPTSLGLREINNLAHFGVSSHKPGNGVDELLSDDLDKYWQSDGQQPHLLTIHFLRRVEIRAIRFYVDYNQDESYTPTHVILYAGTGHHDLIQFAEVPLSNPVGWQDIPIAGCGGGRDGNSLCCWIVQVHIKENHQNGKDTHIRGIKLYALDEKAVGVAGGLDETNNAEVQVRQTRSTSRALSAHESPFHSQPGSPHRRHEAVFDDEDIAWSSLSDFPRGPDIR